MNKARALSLLVPSLVVSACAVAEAPGEPLGSSHAPIISGTPSDKSQDAVVLIIHYDANSQEYGGCTGTLLAPNLVLTARHCVSSTDGYADCNASGDTPSGGAINGNLKPSTLYIYTGTQRPDIVKPSDIADKAVARGAKILDDGSKNLCNHDIGLIVLDKAIDGASIAPVRLDGGPKKGETFTAVGWGVTETTAEPPRRMQRTGVDIVEVGPGDFAASNEFKVGEAICSGDSGGPALAQSGAVIGVVSRGGNYQAPSKQDPSATCIGADNLYTKASPFKDFILQGYAAAGADPWAEGDPDPRLGKLGVACSDGAQCRSALCLPDPTQSNATTCAQDCSGAACPDGLKCMTEGSSKVCRDPAKMPVTTTTTTGPCSQSPAPRSAGGFAFGLALFGLAFKRRRGAR